MLSTSRRSSGRLFSETSSKSSWLRRSCLSVRCSLLVVTRSASASRSSSSTCERAVQPASALCERLLGDSGGSPSVLSMPSASACSPSPFGRCSKCFERSSSVSTCDASALISPLRFVAIICESTPLKAIVLTLNTAGVSNLP